VILPKYEFKLEILKLIISNLTKEQSATFIIIFKEILGEQQITVFLERTSIHLELGQFLLDVLDDI
jgi:hypothetical protein